MGQRENVQASLLAGHGVDSVARRKVADQVKAVVTEGATRVASDAASEASQGFAIETQPADVAAAASAVVLASDLRAPDVIDSHPGAFPFTAQARLNRQGWRARLANVERLLAEFWNNGDAADDLMGEDWAKVQQALAEIRAMIDGE